MEKNSILIVDDDRDIIRFVNENLKQEGFTVFSADNGEEALEVLNNNDVQLAILDVMMPQMDGIELCRRIREKYSLPIMFLSAKSSDIDKVVGFSTGADDYIVKPFSTIEFIARVKAQLRRYTYFNQNAVQVIKKEINIRGLEIDEVSRTVMLYGETINLTKTEYDILYLMAAAMNRVFTIEEIYESVWKERAYESNNTVMVHIARLRNKIEENPKEPKFIQNVWGVGYKIED
ncbi:Two-component system response regulator vanR [Bacillus mycoides]|uniref:Two-component system response regulator vanR n=2 Tax=Bacillus cereus group TaxID=86661 RepID=R8QIC5_BACCE|nr:MULTISPECIES: response regulator transcription factor [Bacillus]EOP70831.1 two-component system response regulator vanR [Bacillus cereus VD118]MBE7147509.1 response regulator transcription factor [Bacillus mycoides]MBW3493479.1 response regulator transcription factor [Bacillus sp. FDAARGOS_1420]RBP20723.1 DNA-binding response OmpR family regulator [Bacillus sp. DB-2]REF33878.1 DNA-binding response OmpR family regulator [Bacillus mycoides]